MLHESDAERAQHGVVIVEAGTGGRTGGVGTVTSLTTDGRDDRGCDTGAAGARQVLGQFGATTAGTAQAELSGMHRAKVFEA